MRLLQRFVRDKSGATAVEYSLIAAGVALAIVAAIGGLGTTVKTMFTSVSTSLK